MSLSHREGERGLAVIAAVIVSAIIFSAAAFGVLIMALSQARMRLDPDVKRLRARYADEAGLVYAMQKLWVDPNYPAACCGGGCKGSTKTDTLALDTDGNGSKETTVTITVMNCGADNDHTLSGQVTY